MNRARRTRLAGGRSHAAGTRFRGGLAVGHALALGGMLALGPRTRSRALERVRLPKEGAKSALAAGRALAVGRAPHRADGEPHTAYALGRRSIPRDTRRPTGHSCATHPRADGQRRTAYELGRRSARATHPPSDQALLRNTPDERPGTPARSTRCAPGRSHAPHPTEPTVNRTRRTRLAGGPPRATHPPSDRVLLRETSPAPPGHSCAKHPTCPGHSCAKHPPRPRSFLRGRVLRAEFAESIHCLGGAFLVVGADGEEGDVVVVDEF
ncbi:hypothetical protein DFR70_116144 [Nocardia tenerifensis]|uniref:Uncharacterized protein n=1 Tax=Nocardia tenerifensis TaxID=228006 RepID=A0A318JSE1_9NOCA|nr:hypothetical protein DFR70_116144 [Nocardia tenerifensis]